MSLTFYSQSMGKGKILNELTPNKIEFPKLKSVGYIVVKSVCEYVK